MEAGKLRSGVEELGGESCGGGGKVVIVLVIARVELTVWRDGAGWDAWIWVDTG